MKGALFIVALLGTVVVAPPAAAHEMVFPVDNLYIVVDAEEGYVEVWEETNDVEGLQKCPDHELGIHSGDTQHIGELPVCDGGHGGH